MPSGIETRELLVGEGEVASRRSIATIRYEGKLGRGDRFGGGEKTIDLGRRDAIPGLRYGIEEMRVGGGDGSRSAGSGTTAVAALEMECK
jgi:FKBP-type peptidyl-prolyl cis-trans isomerase